MSKKDKTRDVPDHFKQPDEDPVVLVTTQDDELRVRMVAAIRRNNTAMSEAFHRGIKKGMANGK